MARTYVHGLVHIRKRQCDTCIFKPEGKGRILGVSDERVAGMVADAVEANSCIPCHHHLYEGEDVEPVCRGFYDRHATPVIRLAEACDIVKWVE